jgi:LysM repeat protein
MSKEVVMTRETKIGLLVGLAFIIVIGILLSDHLTSSTEPPPAQLTQAGNSVRGAMQVPNAEHVSLTPPVTPGPITPQGQVPTSYDLNPRPVGPVVQRIAIGPAQGQEASPNELMQHQPQPGALPQPGTLPQQQAAAASGTNEVAAIYLPPANGNVHTALDTHGAAVRYVTDESLSNAAHKAGEEIVPAKAGAAGHSTEAHGPVTGREYRAVPGDSLSRLAAKLPGGNTKANRDAIMAVNPALKANPNVVIAGRTYILPAAGPAITPAHSAVAAVPAAAAATRQERWYTVKEGDSLWRIASEEVGSAGAVAQIKALNKETLEGSDVVRIGMKLRLPVKAVASVD